MDSKNIISLLNLIQLYYLQETNMKDKKILRAVYSQKMAGWLMLHGYPLISMRQSEENSKYNIFFFYNNSKTESGINEYLKSIND